MKAILVALTAASLLGPTFFTTAQAQSSIGAWRYKTTTHHVRADGRCRGISYGTGARRCDTASGGPSGGRTSGN